MQSFQPLQPLQPLQPFQPLQSLPPPPPPPQPQVQMQMQMQMKTQNRERASRGPGRTVQVIDLCDSDDEALPDGPPPPVPAPAALPSAAVLAPAPAARRSTSTAPASPPKIQMRRLTIDAPIASFDISTEQAVPLQPPQSTNSIPPRINDRFVPLPPPPAEHSPPPLAIEGPLEHHPDDYMVAGEGGGGGYRRWVTPGPQPPRPAISTPAKRTSARSLSTTVSAPGERSGSTVHAQSTPGPPVSTRIEQPRPPPPAPSTPVERPPPYRPDALRTPTPIGDPIATVASAPAAGRNTDKWKTPIRPRQSPTFASERPLPYRKWSSGAAAGPSTVFKTSQSPPLFRYQSSSPSPSPPLPERTKPKVVTHADFRHDPAVPTMQPSPVVSETPVALEDPIAPGGVVPGSSPRKKKKATHVDVIPIDSDSDRHAPVLPADSIPKLRKYSSPIKSAGLSTATRSLLQEFEEEMLDSDDDNGELVVGGGKKRKKKASARRKGKAPAKPKAKIDVVDVVDVEKAKEDDYEESDDTLAASPRKGGGNRLSEAEKSRRAAVKEAAKQQRLKEREAKAAEREEVKAQKKREKEARELERKKEQELALVNKLHTSKKDSVPEMIVDISQHLKDHATGQSLLRFLTGLGCEVNTTWYPPHPADGTTWRIVKWRRKAKAEWDESRGLFIPLPELKVTDGEHVLIYLTAQEFLQASKRGLAEHIALLRGFSPLDPAQVKPIYVVEGMEALIRRNKNNRNRAYQNRVRAVLGEDGSVPADAEVLDEDAVQDAMLEAQVVHGCLVHHTATGIESAEWISRFTGDISTIPYRNSRTSTDVRFCADIGQVRVGVGKKDIYLRMLEQINRITPSVAASIESVYPDVQTLVAAFKDQGEDALAEIPNQMARNGLERNLGPSISRRVYAIFMDADPESIEI